jgi:DNA polymerase III epsilon subunit family exonuclease
MKYVVFDTETTGLLRPSRIALEDQPRIIEIGVVNNRGAINWLVNPGVPISAEITKITGIKDEDVKDAPKFREIIPDLADMFAGADILVAHNAQFDLGMLQNELKRVGYDSFPFPETIICSVQEYFPEFGRRMKLEDLYLKKLGKPLVQTHRASDDAAALLEVLLADNFFEKIG